MATAIKWQNILRSFLNPRIMCNTHSEKEPIWICLILQWNIVSRTKPRYQKDCSWLVPSGFNCLIICFHKMFRALDSHSFPIQNRPTASTIRWLPADEWVERRLSINSPEATARPVKSCCRVFSGGCLNKHTAQ